jgi:hypothetical protein
MISRLAFWKSKKGLAETLLNVQRAAVKKRKKHLNEQQYLSRIKSWAMVSKD